MDKEDNRTGAHEITEVDSNSEKDYGFSTTVEIFNRTFVGKIPTKHCAYLEIMGYGKNNKVIEIGEGGLTIGRSPECEIELSVNKISRKHACVIFQNEEYHIEDLGSTNGIYVNGVRVVKCVLRKHDEIEIGGIRIIFTEDKMPIKT